MLRHKMARMDQAEYHNGSWSVPGLRPPDPTMSPHGSSRESNPCRVTYSPRLSPTTHQRLFDTRGKTCAGHHDKQGSLRSAHVRVLLHAGLHCRGTRRHAVEWPQRRAPRISAATLPCAGGQHAHVLIYVDYAMIPCIHAVQIRHACTPEPPRRLGRTSCCPRYRARVPRPCTHTHMYIYIYI
jgi:hypothetical protein